MDEVSKMDVEHLKAIRENVNKFVEKYSKKYDVDGKVVLDIAPQDHDGAKPYFFKAKVETLDINKESGATYIADLCEDNSATIENDKFDIVVCTEVLEHTLRPFDAVNEIHRMLKQGGLVLASSPFNFRIHGPLPDCWRFTEHGWRMLFKDFEIIELSWLETKDRYLMPIHYTLIARKKNEK